MKRARTGGDGCNFCPVQVSSHDINRLDPSNNSVIRQRIASCGWISASDCTMSADGCNIMGLSLTIVQYRSTRRLRSHFADCLPLPMPDVSRHLRHCRREPAVKCKVNGRDLSLLTCRSYLERRKSQHRLDVKIVQKRIKTLRT